MRSRVGVAIAIIVRATPTVHGGIAFCGNATISSPCYSPSLSVKIFEIVTIAIIIGIVPLALIVWEGISKAVGMRNPPIIRIGISIHIRVKTAKPVSPTYPTTLNFFNR